MYLAEHFPFHYSDIFYETLIKRENIAEIEKTLFHFYLNFVYASY